MARTSREARAPSFAMLLLLNEIFKIATNYGIPTVTAIFTAGQICLYMGYLQVPWREAWDVCISVEKAYFKNDWKRLIMSAFEHGNDWHLYYNMVSFLWKGRELEKRMGSIRFFFLLLVFTVLTSCSYIGLNLLFFEFTRNRSFLRSCAVGFSGVIFALKVLTTHYSSSSYYQSFMGIPVSTKYAYWAELVLIQLISPNASFVGHLAGIVVGLLYTKGPLKYIFDFVEGAINSNSSERRDNSRSQNNYNFESEEEQMRRATEESLRDFGRTTYQRRPYPSAPPPPYPTSYPSAPPYPNY